MGLFGSLFTGVSGLNAESQATAFISNNIANTNTIGFKRSESSFSSLVTSQGRLSRFSPGTVQTNRLQRIDQQGSIQQTSSATDAAISGNGFFAVKQDSNDLSEFLYTRNGQFSEDAQGFLTNSAGFVLHAWPLDSQGNLPQNFGELTSLVPANVAFLGGLTRPTTNADLGVNLDGSTEALNIGSIVDVGGTDTQTRNGGDLGGPTGNENFPTPSSVPRDFTRGLTVFDSLGQAQTLNIEYTKVTGPQATVQTNAPVVLTRDTVLSSIDQIDVGEIFTIDRFDTVAPGATASVDFIVAQAPGAGETRVDTVGELLDAINDSTLGIRATLTSAGELRLQAENYVSGANTIAAPNEGIRITDAVGDDAAFAGLRFPNPNAGQTETYQPFSLDTGSAQSTTNPYGFTDAGNPNNQADFPDLSNGSTPNPDGWWQVRINLADGSTVTQGLINFDGDGSLNAAQDGDGNVDIELTDVEFIGNGNPEPQDIEIDVSRFSQFAGNFDVIFSDQNGAELGLRTGVELTAEGQVIARFSNGATSPLFQLPLVTFANANGLAEVSGSSFSESEDSGEENLRVAGTGGAGFVEPSTVEQSNVDLADEFARLIVSQRSFSANSRLVNTVDQMTQDLLRLR